jgi:hypothetical protein
MDANVAGCLSCHTLTGSKGYLNKFGETYYLRAIK